MTKYENSLPLQLIKARDIAMHFFRPVLADNDLTEQQWRVLRVLDTKGAIDFSTLSKETCILSPSLTGIISRLEKHGLVTKEKSPHDGRQFYIHLTDKSQSLLEQLRPQIEQQYVALKEALGESKYQQLSDLLNELIAVHHK
ncbi:homoprotocatechuate degradation operon regulator HpaR [Vibrio sinaloensis]|uniref:homoprotocatechuate degradation operon regulator HpaR n=1 Tax=Photobacterium sp. (strain ATCC 43367) TaxID=379097 RepID=UPI0020590904|nr:homoprotocatechuate degradation operon regulator HpaR [Vibrio sinaloensis]UPQ90295.1 homoprotocatechuate degradation operon regulator HpaR [Vibrio sinaloensis]